MDKLKSTKVQGFWFFGIASTFMLWFDKLGGGEYLAMTTLLFTIFTTANVVQKKVLDEQRH